MDMDTVEYIACIGQVFANSCINTLLEDESDANLKNKLDSDDISDIWYAASTMMASIISATFTYDKTGEVITKKSHINKRRLVLADLVSGIIIKHDLSDTFSKSISPDVKPKHIQQLKKLGYTDFANLCELRNS